MKCLSPWICNVWKVTNCTLLTLAEISNGTHDRGLEDTVLIRVRFGLSKTLPTKGLIIRLLVDEIIPLDQDSSQLYIMTQSAPRRDAYTLDWFFLHANDLHGAIVKRRGNNDVDILLIMTKPFFIMHQWCFIEFGCQFWLVRLTRSVASGNLTIASTKASSSQFWFLTT